MDNIKVSIIIPVYNTEKYLKQCLDSVIKQTFKDIEIIVVNDCSPDNSLQIIKEYQQKDNRIILVNLEKKVGLGFARNEGMKVAKGKYITFIDSDDWVKENFVEILYTNIEQYNTDFVSVDYIKYDDVVSIFYKNERSSKFKFYNTIIDKENLKQNILLNIPTIQVWTKIFNTKFLLSNNIYFKINKLEDNLFMWEVIIKSKNFIFLKDTTYYHRKNRPNSIMSNDYIKIIEYEFILFEQLKDMLIKNQYYYKYKKYFIFYILRHLIFLFENYNLDYKTSNMLIVRFKNLYKYELNTSTLKYISVTTKIKILILKYCLKYNINYIIFVKCYIKLSIFLKNIRRRKL